MSPFVLTFIAVVVLMFASAPRWPYSRSWGYYPSGGLGLILVVLIVLALLGRI